MNYFIDLPFAHGKPIGKARFKDRIEDFVVEENLPFEPTNEGEHVFILVKKQQQNTVWIAKQIAKRLEIPKSAISFAGLKDRHSIAKQWFSIHLPGKESASNVVASLYGIDGITILEATRHLKKLKTGTIKENQFSIRLRDYEGTQHITEQRLAEISEQGVPNYFGYQRFGLDGKNIAAASAMFENKTKVSRHERSILLSTARSFIFNRILADRVKNKTWNQWQEGDVLTFPNNNSLI